VMIDQVVVYLFSEMLCVGGVLPQHRPLIFFDRLPEDSLNKLFFVIARAPPFRHTIAGSRIPVKLLIRPRSAFALARAGSSQVTVTWLWKRITT
jgi:hypothetical protein